MIAVVRSGILVRRSIIAAMILAGYRNRDELAGQSKESEKPSYKSEDAEVSCAALPRLPFLYLLD